MNKKEYIKTRKESAKKLLKSIDGGLSGKELFNNRDWYRINRLMIYFCSDEEAIMFSMLCDVENKWISRRNSFMKDLGGYFLLTVEYVSTFLNKNADQQRRALKRLEDKKLISIKYWAGKKRLIKINWIDFTTQYIEWIKKYNKIEEDPFETMIDTINDSNRHLSILEDDMPEYI